MAVVGTVVARREHSALTFADVEEAGGGSVSDEQVKASDHVVGHWNALEDGVLASLHSVQVRSPSGEHVYSAEAEQRIADLGED